MAILVGVGAGLLVAMFVIMRQEKRYRVLFSDTHLADLAKCLEAARNGPPTRTFEGVTVAWERMPEHSAITLSSDTTLAAPAARFLLTFVAELVGEASPRGLQIGKRSFAALLPRAIADREVAQPEGKALMAMRVRAADGMKGLAVVEGSLAAYR